MDPDNNPPLPLRRRRLAGVPPDAAADVHVLLRVATSCPRCGTRPALRVTQAMVRALAGADAGVRLGTYQCQRRGCGAIYDLEAGAYLRAG